MTCKGSQTQESKITILTRKVNPEGSCYRIEHSVAAVRRMRKMLGEQPMDHVNHVSCITRKKIKHAALYIDSCR